MLILEEYLILKPVKILQSFVYFARVRFCPFSLPLGVRALLRLLIMALPGLFYSHFV